MGTAVASYFFKEDDNELTVEKLQELGFAAARASNGFIEAYPIKSIVLAEKKLELNRELTRHEHKSIVKAQEQSFLEALIAGVKDSAPRLMFYSDIDEDEPELLVFNSPTDINRIESTESDVHTRDVIEDFIEETYGLESFYRDINFARYTETDLLSKAQTVKLRMLKDEFEDRKYHGWLRGFVTLGEAAKLGYVLEVARDYNSNSLPRFSPKNDELTTSQKLNNIERFINEAKSKEDYLSEVKVMDGVFYTSGKVNFEKGLSIMKNWAERQDSDDIVLDCVLANHLNAALCWGKESDTDALRHKLGVKPE